jgi:hypothetical protein
MWIQFRQSQEAIDSADGNLSLDELRQAGRPQVQAELEDVEIGQGHKGSFGIEFVLWATDMIRRTLNGL